MTSRERIKTVLRGEIPDCVPVDPDISNMIPCRLTGKPFWDIYVRQDPPLWKAYIDAVKYFGIDGGVGSLYSVDIFEDDKCDKPENRIVHRNEDGSFVTQEYFPKSGTWSEFVVVHTADQPPPSWLRPQTIGLPPVPSTWEPVTGVKEWPTGIELWKLVKKEMGEHGVVPVLSGMCTLLLNGAEGIYEYYDHPEKTHERREQMMDAVEKRMNIIAGLDEKPDLILCGGSGTLVFQTPDFVREMVIPMLKKTAGMAYDLGIPTHVHSCGPEKELVKMVAEETRVTVIDPLEMPPMGNCDLKELKRLYGKKIVLKGNLHTTDVMLRGTVDDVVRASKKAIDDAAEGGRFILSTGDQCGRDTPFENIHAMVETARTYGRY
ncbi:MAG: uroporphyrinogen decarboxylase family protein [Victivallales bacterium]